MAPSQVIDLGLSPRMMVCNEELTISLGWCAEGKCCLGERLEALAPQSANVSDTKMEFSSTFLGNKSTFQIR